MTAHPEGMDWSWCDNAVDHGHVNNPLRDSLAHSYAHELPPARPTFEPVRGGWKEVAEILAGMVVLIALFLGIPFLLWVMA